jgi:hypothetical protein
LKNFSSFLIDMADTTKTYFEKSLRLRYAAFALIGLIWINCIALPVRADAQTDTNEISIPAGIYPGLDHFLALVDPVGGTAFDSQMVGGVLDFIETPKKEDAIYFANRISGLTSAYYEFDIDTSLEKLAGYSFNADIPAIAAMPSSVRLFQWVDARGQRQAPPRVAQGHDEPDTPLVWRGFQFLEITPDLTSGAYYAYKSRYTFLFFSYRRRKVIVTLARQADVSAVGKKGYILGSDNDWDYYYSGKTGLTLPALGWVRSYMYDSGGINIYYEIDPGAPRVRCAMFNWLRAGWSNINMVQKKHIYAGLKRFAVPFKEILEYPALPSVARMADDFSRIKGLSEATLISRMEIYSKLLEKRYATGKQRTKKWPSDLFENKNHWRQMSREEMESTLVIEYMKYALGKSRLEEVREFLGLNR